MSFTGCTFLMRPTHPFFGGPLAPGDLVPCPSHEHQSKHFDRKRWPSVSRHHHRLLPPSPCCWSPFLEEHDVEQSIPGVRSHTHKQKHPETSRVCSPLRRNSRTRENALRQQVQEPPPRPQQVQVGPEFPMSFSFGNSHFSCGGGRRARAVATGTTEPSHRSTSYHFLGQEHRFKELLHGT